MKIKIGTRKSKLALIQTNIIKNLIEKNTNHKCEIVEMSTLGDDRRDLKLTDFGGKGAFVDTIEKALLDKSIDIAVHSAKDLPVQLEQGLEIGAVAKRANPQDVLIMAQGKTISSDSVIGTGSIRRQLQIKAKYGCKCKDIRGNVPTRLKKLDDGEYDGIILARAGLDRLDMIDIDKYNYEFFETLDFVPAPCQGIIAVENRADDEYIRDVLKAINHMETYVCFVAERAFLKAMDSGCQTPLGAISEIGENNLKMECFYYKDRIVKMSIEGENPVLTAAVLAKKLKEVTMEKINKMERSKHEQNIIRIVKGSLFAIILTFIFLFIFATILTYSNIPESTITPIVIIITAISILIGSAKSTRNINKNGMINGGMVGLIYITFLYVSSSIVFSGLQLSFKSIIMIISAILAGIIGGIIGVNFTIGDSP